MDARVRAPLVVAAQAGDGAQAKAAGAVLMAVYDIKHTRFTLLMFRWWNRWCRLIGHLHAGPDGKVRVTMTTCWPCRVLSRTIDWVVRTEERR